MSQTGNESGLVYRILKEIGKHCAVFRCNSGSVVTKDGRRFHGLPKGFADIMCILPGGRVAFIECKTDNGKLSPEQERFLAKMQALGCRAGIARTLEDAAEICELSVDTAGDA